MSKDLKKIVLASGAGVAVVAIVAFASFQGGKSGVDEAAGTIMQAQRQQAESTPASEDDEATTEVLSAEQLAEPDTGQTDADRAQADEAAKAKNTGNYPCNPCMGI